MTLFTAIFLGIIEGICEFLPISGGGHMALLHNLFRIDEPAPLFNLTLHAALLISIYISFHTEVQGVFSVGKKALRPEVHKKKQSKKERSYRRLFVLVLLGTLPLIPALFLRSLASRLSMSTLFVSLMLLLNGALIWFAAKQGKMRKTEDKISRLDILCIGIAQLISIFPGISRSGATISIALLLGLPRKFSIKYAFLLRIPSLIACICIYFIEAVRYGITISMIPAYLIGSVFAAVFGVLAMRFLRWICARNGFGVFAYYCWGASLVTLMLSLIS